MIKRLLLVVFIVPGMVLTIVLVFPLAVISWVITGKAILTTDLFFKITDKLVNTPEND